MLVLREGRSERQAQGRARPCPAVSIRTPASQVRSPVHLPYLSCPNGRLGVRQIGFAERVSGRAADWSSYQERRTGIAAAMRRRVASGCSGAVVLEEEPDRLGGRVRALRVGVGANRTTAIPGMSAAVDN